MPPVGEAIDDPTSSDDYVAQLLAKDARDSSIKYSAVGLQAYLPRRPTTAAAKPNTRFLKNILRDTDSHNAALKKKEEEEARERMRKLRAAKSSSGVSQRSDEDHGKREAKRRRVDERDDKRSFHRSRDAGILDDDRSRRRRRRRDSDDSDNGHHRSSRRHRHRDEDDRHHSRRHKERSTSPSRSSRHEREYGRHQRHRSRRHSSHRSLSRSPSRSRSPESPRNRKHISEGYKERRRSRERYRIPSHLPSSGGKSERRRDEPSQATSISRPAPARETHLSGDDSDPLADLIGPLPLQEKGEPVVRSRGRGAYRSNTANIDAHFASNYDPTLDVHLEDEEAPDRTKPTRRLVTGLMTEDDDWDMALEALRDRAVWKKKGADRLREAGFEDNVVERWTNNAAFTGLGNIEQERSIEDVKWARKGEGREWDRGKVLTEDGHVDVKAPW